VSIDANQLPPYTTDGENPARSKGVITYLTIVGAELSVATEKLCAFRASRAVAAHCIRNCAVIMGGLEGEVRTNLEVANPVFNAHAPDVEGLQAVGQR